MNIPRLSAAQDFRRLLVLAGPALLFLTKSDSTVGLMGTDYAMIKADPAEGGQTLHAPPDYEIMIDVDSMDKGSIYRINLLASDIESANTMTYTLAYEMGTGFAKSTIDSTMGVLSYNTLPNFEAVTGIGGGYGDKDYQMVAQVSGGALSDMRTYSPNVQNINLVPTSTSSDRASAASAVDNAQAESQAITVSVPSLSGASSITSDGGGATASVNVDENQTAVTTVVATDDGGITTNIYSLVSVVGTDYAKFAINSTTGVLTFLSSPDYESPTDVGGVDGDNAYEVVVMVYDGENTDTQTITVNVQDVNAVPAIASNGGGATALVNANENQMAVTTVVATDDGENTNTKTYSLVNTAGTDYAKFAIHSTTGILTFLASPDYESPTDIGGVDGDNAYEVDVQVSDGALIDTQTITVNVQDVNAAPAITSNGGGSTASVNANENQTSVTTVVASDDGENSNTKTYSLVNTAGTDYAKFAIDSTTGVLTFLASPDYESPTDIGGVDGDNAYEVDVQVSDGAQTDIQTITINVQNINVAPSITSDGGGSTASVSANENQTAVTTVVASDDGENSNTKTYSLVNTAGTDYAKFAIDSTTGVLTFLASPNYEAPTDIGGPDGDNAYVVVVQVSDGALTDTQTITVNVQNINVAPSITSDGGGATASVSIDENQTAVTTVAASDDGENTNTKTYSIVSTAGTDYAKFAINSSTGVLTFIAPPDYETPTDVGGADGDNAYEVVVQVSDGALTDTQTITVNVQNLNAAPAITSDGGSATALVNADENQMAVTTVAASDDGENINALTYSIVSTAGTDFAKFAINATTGVLTFITPPDYESPTDVGGADSDNAYEVVVQVSDGVLNDTQTITVSVQDLNGLPAITSNGGGTTASINADENQTGVTTVVAVTDDGADTLTKVYSIVNTAGTDFAKFAIDPNTGVLTFIAPPDYETPTDVGGADGDNAYEVIVQVTDGALTDTQTITVNVQDINLAPSITSDGGGATASVSVDENQTAVTTVVATDDTENTNTKTYSIVSTAGTDFAKFAIDPNTGVLTFIAPPDYETPTDVGGADGDNAYEVIVQVSDGVLTDTQTITVDIQDLNTAPTISSNGGGATASVNADENQTAVTTVAATDDGENVTKTYSIVSTAGTDFAKFAINATTGALTFITPPDYESPTDVGGADGDNAYEVVVQVSDGALTDTQTITVNVQDLNESPTDIIWNAVVPASETDIPDSVTIANLTTLDSDNLVGFTYSLQSQSIVSGSDANGGGFAVSDAGVVSASSMVDGNTYLLVIRSQDVNTAFVDESFHVIAGTSGADTLPSGGAADSILTGDDIIYGTEGNDIIYGGSGNDTLAGQAGDDQLYGGTGTDLLIGGLGSDIFYFSSTGESSATLASSDVISGFTHGVDRISLSAIDANLGTGANDAFLFGGNNVNTVAFSATWSESGGDTIIHIDNSGDTTADMQIVLTGTGLNLDATDFIL